MTNSNRISSTSIGWTDPRTEVGQLLWPEKVTQADLSSGWPELSLKLVEDKANGPAVIQSLRHEISGFVEVNPEGGKVSRAVAASPQLESGNWYLPHPLLARWVEGFIGECAAVPRFRVLDPKVRIPLHLRQQSSRCSPQGAKLNC